MSKKFNKKRKEKKNKNKKFISSKSATINIKALIFCMIVLIGFFITIIIRLFYWQFIKAEDLKEIAYNQQLMNQTISPKRGNIYDSNGTPLAISSVVDTISINPNLIVSTNLSDDDQTRQIKTKAIKEQVSKGLSEIFELDYDELLEKVNSNSNSIIIAKKVEQEKVTQLKNWMDEINYHQGINIDEDSKRTYPLNNVASHIIGFCGNENQGLTGLESNYNSILSGTPGKIISYQSRQQNEIPDTEQLHKEAENGMDITLTIDVNIQQIAQRHLKDAVDRNNCERGGNVIIMNPKNGEILAMASYPDYNLNDPFSPNEKLSTYYDSLSQKEKNDAINEMWRNKSVMELYEPGSVFKLITSSIALEENITDTDIANDFNCTGVEVFSDGTKINCWAPVAHGSQDLRHALMNSCNPAFMQLGRRIGKDLLYKYYRAFGLMDKTGIGLSEENSLFTDYTEANEVEVATMSFGQRLNITPLQMITAISAIANDGILLEPHIVKYISNSETGYKQYVEKKEIRQVISETTANKVKSMMFSVVDLGTAKGAKVAGYNIGGKTGTSEPLNNKKEEGYVASFAAVAPIDDPEFVILLSLYKPLGNKHQGGEIAAPVVANIMSDLFNYLGIEPTN